MPIHFTCPHCGLTTDVDDLYAGQCVQCVRCKKPITYPLPEGTERPGDVGLLPPLDWEGEKTTCRAFPLFGLLILFLFICAFIPLLLPSICTAREAARRAQCMNNLKQIGLAIANYEAEYGRFPPAYIPDEDGKPKHSWRVLILPFLQEQSLYKEYRFDEPWDGPHNRALAAKMPLVYRCPSESRPAGTGITSYAMIVGPNAFSDGPTARRIKDIPDGTDHTIMVAEAAGAGINWLEPLDLYMTKMSFRVRNFDTYAKENPNDIASGHPNGANAVFCDDSLRFLSNDIEPNDLKAMLTIDGGETIPD